MKPNYLHKRIHIPSGFKSSALILFGLAVAAISFGQSRPPQEFYEFEVTGFSFSEDCEFYGNVRVETKSGFQTLFSAKEAHGSRFSIKKDQVVPVKQLTIPSPTPAKITLRTLDGYTLNDRQFRLDSKLYLWKGVAEAVKFSPTIPQLTCGTIRQESNGQWIPKTITVNADNYQQWNPTMKLNYRYRRVVDRSATTDPSIANLPDHVSLIRPNNPILDAVGDQGNEESCVAWAVCGAIGTTVLKDWYRVSTSDAAPVERFMELGVNMLNAKYFYALRHTQAYYARYNRAKKADDDAVGEGWWYDLALKRASEVTIPFNVDPSYGIRLIATDARGAWAQPYVEIKNLDRMRQELYSKRPLLARFDRYSDFQNHSKRTNLYQWAAPGSSLIGGHAVMVVGYHKPRPGSLGESYWECQNSWGTQFGRNGFFKIGEGTCGIDASMWMITNWALCRLSDNKKVDDGTPAGFQERNRIMSSIVSKIKP